MSTWPAAGIVLGSIIACCNISRAKRRGPRLDPPILPATLFFKGVDRDRRPDRPDFGLGHYQATWKPQPLLLPAGRAPGGRAWAVAVTIVLAVGGGAFYWHHTSKGEAKRPLAPPPVSHVGSEFEGSTADLAFNPCPRTWNVSNGFRVDLLSSVVRRAIQMPSSILDELCSMPDTPERLLIASAPSGSAAAALRKSCRLPIPHLSGSTIFPVLSKWRVN